jgi:hypothetical protein
MKIITLYLVLTVLACAGNHIESLFKNKTMFLMTYVILECKERLKVTLISLAGLSWLGFTLRTMYLTLGLGPST